MQLQDAYDAYCRTVKEADRSCIIDHKKELDEIRLACTNEEKRVSDIAKKADAIHAASAIFDKDDSAYYAALDAIIAYRDTYNWEKANKLVDSVKSQILDAATKGDMSDDEINALIGMESFKEAYAVYDETVRYYTDELGVTPSNDLLECYDKMSRQITNTPGKILQIRDGILEHRGAVAGDDEGAYDCSFPSFIDAYHILSRNMERSGQSVYMMLLNIVDYEGKRITNAAKLETRAKLLQEAITLTLRQGDTFCKYSASQFLLLLVGTNKESCKTVYRRLLNKFKLLAGPRTELEYSVVSLADLPDRLAQAE